MLELNVKSDEEHIKANYLRLAKTYHPDLNKSPGAKERFSEILEAYDILSDKIKRKIYDESGLTSEEQEDLEYVEEVGQPKPGYFAHPVEYLSELEPDFIDEVEKNEFNNVLKKLEKFYGKPVEEHNFVNISNENSFPILVNLTISFSEYIKGASKNVNYHKIEICPDCKGLICA
jgi:DnaJ-class molecular chaperone